MSLDGDLLEQAGHLARRDPTRPKQASLRRAISASYYALFHLLVREATARLVSDPGLRRLVPRTFDHSEMKQACRPFMAGALPDHLHAITSSVVPDDLKIVAQAFVDLQQSRHEADYNVAARFGRADAIASVQQVESAFEAWERVRAQQIASVFLASLLFTNRWKR